MINLLELLYDFVGWVNEFFLGFDENILLYSGMTNIEKVKFEKELADLVSKNLILQKDMDIMIERGDEVRQAIEDLFDSREINYLDRKEFFKSLIRLLRSFELSPKYINYVIRMLAPYVH